jgi:hypothetical protein
MRHRALKTGLSSRYGTDGGIVESLPCFVLGLPVERSRAGRWHRCRLGDTSRKVTT